MLIKNMKKLNIFEPNETNAWNGRVDNILKKLGFKKKD